MKKFLLAPFLAALATVFWGMLYWGTPPMLPYKALGPVADPAATALELGKMFPASGAYLVPSPTLGSDQMMELSLRGPMVEVHITKEPMTPAVQTKTIAMGFVHMFMVSLLLVIILTSLEKAFKCWTCRVKFCAALGLLVGAYNFIQAIWWHHSVAWTLGQSLYDFSLFTIAGLVIAKFVTPKEPAPAA